MTFFRHLTTLAISATATLALVASAGAVEWRLGHILPPEHPGNQALEEAATEIAEQTEGRVEISVFPAGQIGGAKEILTGLQLGTTEMAFDGAGILSQWSAPLSVLEAPYLAKDFDHLKRLVESDTGQQLIEDLRQSAGMRLLDVWYYGTRQMTNDVRPINTPADVEGIKLRVPEVDLSLRFAEALGATPTPMAFPELYLGLQTGVVDGQENPLSTIEAAKFYEVQDHLALTNHLVQFVGPIVSESAWNAISEQDQQTILDIFKEKGEAYSAEMIETEQALVETLEDNGMQVTRPDTAPFAEAMTPVYESMADVWGEGVYEALSAVE